MGNAYCCSHGACMVVAWVGFSSIGQIVAKHYRNVWQEVKIFGKDFWFAVHWTCMVLCFVFTVAGVGIIYARGTSKNGNAHASIGIIVLILCLLQPVMGTFRPKPTAQGRVWFNWAHWAVGNMAHLLAVLNIYSAFAIPSIRQPIDCYSVTTAYLFWHIGVDFFLAKWRVEKAKLDAQGNTDLVVPFNNNAKPPTPWAVGFEPENSRQIGGPSRGDSANNKTNTGWNKESVPKIVFVLYVVVCMSLTLLLSLMVVGTVRFDARSAEVVRTGAISQGATL